jgi:hypothetical protein
VLAVALRGGSVGGGAVAGEPQGGGEDVAPLVEVGGETFETVVGIASVAVRAFLFGLEGGQVDGVGVVGVEQLAAPVGDAGQAAGLQFTFGGVPLGLLRDLVLQFGGEPAPPPCWGSWMRW